MDVKAMRIGVNLIPLRPGRMGGHEFYVRSLLHYLLAHNTRDQYFLFTAWWNDDSLHFPPGRYRKILAIRGQDPEYAGPNGSNRRVARLFNPQTLPLVRHRTARPSLDLHAWVRRLRLDLWFCPMTNLEPRQLPIPTVITIPDIQQEYYPEFFTRAELRERALMYRPSCQEATAVITVSHFSKAGMIEKYSLPPEKLHCIYEAAVERAYEPSSLPTVEEVRRKYQLPATYAFYPANMWPHKNHQMLILALHRLRQLYGMALSLVLTGDDLGQWAELEALARHFQLQAQVHYLGYVAAEDLPVLYRSAALLVFPSLFEGFGIPLVEAMALGCPIAAAKTASIPEVVGDAALLFDPRSPDAVANAIYGVLADDDLRQALVVRGREQAARFSWQQAAAETRQVFAWARAQHPAVHAVPQTRRSRLEGMYADGWATRRVRLSLPYLPDMKGLKIDGFSDHLSYPLAIRMKVDGRRVQELSIANPGRFTFVGEFLGFRKAMSEVRIELVAGKDFVPADIENSPDTRRLAYQIENLWLICVNNAEIPLFSAPGEDVSSCTTKHL
jgi:glycosyltransferase involved in cell wall biosynthesis